MTNVTLQFNPYDKNELDEALVVVGTLRQNLETKTHKVTAAAAPIAAAKSAVDAAGKRGRGRPRKAEPSPAEQPLPFDGNDSPASAEGGAVLQTPASVAPVAVLQTPSLQTPPVWPTLEECRNALAAYVGARNTQAGIELVAAFGVRRISEIPEEKRAEFIAKAQANG